MQKKTEKWGFIANPIAGNRDGEKLIPVLEEKIKQYNINGEIALTEAPGHATKLAHHFAEKGCTHIVSLGGDGTMNEVAKALHDKENIIKGIIPAGTGNDFIQILGFPDRFEEEHWETFFQQHIISMDYGKCNGKVFLNGVGLGFDAEVAAKNYVAPGETSMGGKRKYIGHILHTLFFYREGVVTFINGDGREDISECFINTVSNGRRYAGGFYLTPLAIANDGLLDVCMIRKIGLLKRLHILSKVTQGKHVDDKVVNYYTTDKISVDFKKEVPCHVDGELFHAEKFDVEIFPQKYPILYNPNGSHFFNAE